MKKLIIGGLASSLIALATLAHAAEVKSIAILTPEAGTDYGWNQQGIAAAKAAAEKAGIKAMVAENLGYGDVRPTLREMAEDGASLIIAHASGYNTAAPEIGAETKVPVAITDNPSAAKPGAVADYTMSGHEGAYLAGALAPCANAADCEFQDGGSPEVTMPTVPVLLIIEARRPAR